MLAAALSSCVAPARSFGAYEGKAVEAAKAVASAAQTARVAVEALVRGDVTVQFASVVAGEAERDADGAQGSFASAQPPDDRSDALREEALALIEDATDALAEIRIAVRRSEISSLEELASKAASAAEALAKFAEARE